MGPMGVVYGLHPCALGLSNPVWPVPVESGQIDFGSRRLVAFGEGRRELILLTGTQIMPNKIVKRDVETEDWQVKAIQQAVDELEQGQADLVSHDAVASWLDRWGTDRETSEEAWDA